MATRTDLVRLTVMVDSKDARQELDRFEQKTEQTAKSATTSSGKMTKGFSDLKSSITKVTLALAAVGAAVAVVDRFAERAAKVSEVSTAFNTLNERIGTVSATMLGGLRRASRGLITDMDLMAQANNAMILGVAQNERQMEELTAAAVTLGKAVGLDAASSMESLVTGLGRQSRLMLDNLGIIVSADEAYRHWAEAHGVLVSEMTEAQRKLAFIEEGTKKATEAATGLTEQTILLSDEWRQLKTDIINATDALADWINRSGEAQEKWKSAEARRVAALLGIALPEPEPEPEPPPFGGSTRSALAVSDQLGITLEKAKAIRAAISDPANKEKIFESWYEPIRQSREEAEQLEFHINRLRQWSLDPIIQGMPELPGVEAPGLPDLIPMPSAADQAPLYSAIYEMEDQFQAQLRDVRLSSDQLSFDERRSLELARLQESYQAQIAIARQAGADTAAIEEAWAAERAQIERNLQQQKLQLASTALGGLASIMRAAGNESKSLAQFTAVVQTAAGVTQALGSQPYPYNLIAAAVVAATGAAQLANINRAEYGNPGGVISPSGATLAGGGQVQTPESGPQQQDIHIYIESDGFVTVSTMRELAREVGDEIMRQNRRAGDTY